MNGYNLGYTTPLLHNFNRNMDNMPSYVKPSMMSRLAGLFGDTTGMSADEKSALGRQGLLMAGLGILANNDGRGTGRAIGSGLLQGIGMTQQMRQQQLRDQRGLDDPAQFRAMDMAARAAGYEPGTQGYMDYFRRANGELARQSSAAIQYRTEIGSDGKPRVVAYDPRQVGAHVIGDGTTYGSGVGASGPRQQVQFQDGTILDLTDIEDPVFREQVAKNPDAFGATLLNGGELNFGTVGTYTPAPALPARSSRSGVNPFVGPDPVQQAGDIVGAQEAARLAYLPSELGMRTNAAVDQTRQLGPVEAYNTGIAKVAALEAEGQYEAAANLGKVVDNAAFIEDTVQKLLNHDGLDGIVGLRGTVDPSRFVPGSPQRGAYALLEQVKGQAFSDAFETLKGGGAITEAEGRAATAARNRMETTQNREDFEAAAQDYLAIVRRGVQRAQSKTGGNRLPPTIDYINGGSVSPDTSRRVRRYNPATGRIE